MNQDSPARLGPQRVAVLGAGALGQQIAQHLRQNEGYAVVGFLDDTLPVGHHCAEGRVIGAVATAIGQYQQAAFDGLVMGIGYRHLAARQQLFEQLSQQVPFISFIHPAAIVDPSAQIAPGCFISAGCVLDLNVQVGPNTFLYPGCILAHNVKVQGHSFFAPGVRLAGHVEVGPRCFLGIGTTIIDSLLIGAGVQTGGGTVVVRSLAESGTYVGVPARCLMRSDKL